MNKKQIGEKLKSELAKGYDVVRISRWAFKIYSENLKSLTPSLCEILESLFAMEDDPQFELTHEQLEILADKLISEGNKEEIECLDLEIWEKAEQLENFWLMCPICQEAWEDQSVSKIVCCPRCKKKMHNPRVIV